LNPLRVQHVRLGTGATTRKLPWFHQFDLKALGFQELKQRNPIDTGGFQSDGSHAALLQPCDDLLEIGSVGAELSDRVGVPVGWDTNHVHIGMHVDLGRIWVDDLQRRGRGRDGDRNRPLGRLIWLG
jgi:hypothetical protein